MLLRQVGGEVVEHAQLIAVQVSDSELAQAPGLILRLGENFCASLLPGAVELIHLLFALQIEPDDNGTASSGLFPKLRVGEKHPAIPLRNAADATLVIAPIEVESQHIDVILGGFLNVADGNLRNGLGEVCRHEDGLHCSA